MQTPSALASRADAAIIATRRRESLSVFIVALGFSALYAALAGQDANWDQRNYHIYAVHAWLNGQTFWHLAPAQIQSWLNPLPHVPQVWLITTARPIVAGATLGAIAGINGWLVWLLMRRYHGWSPNRSQRLLALVVLILAVTGSLFLSFLGTTWAEYLCSCFVLASLLPLVPGRDDGHLPTSWRALLFAGLSMGAACGLKLTNLVYAIGLTAALLTLAPRVMLWWGGLAYAAGGLLGFLLTGGFWAVTLWRELGSPMFPFFNAVFGSPMFGPTNFADVRFIPASVLQAAMTYPFEWLLNRHPTCEVPFREARFAAIAVLLPIAAIVAVSRSRLGSRLEPKAQINGDNHRFWLLVLFFTISYVVWLWQFAIQRYAFPLELLAGVILVIAIGTILENVRWNVLACGAIAAFLVAWTKPPDWSRVPYGPDWFAISLEPSQERVMYILLGADPMAYLAPSLSPGDRLVRIDGNMPLRPDRYLGREAKRLIEEHRGRVRTLSAVPIHDGHRALLAGFGLVLAIPERCNEIRTTMDRFIACDAVPLSNPSAAASPPDYT